MVLDAGKLVEFDSPNELLRRVDSLFRALVDESAEKGSSCTVWYMAMNTRRCRDVKGPSTLVNHTDILVCLPRNLCMFLQ
jgi:hypothetical protein